jgi:MoCo/4Fe-4S cofactor protein with predicted Tat translocation signal
MSEQRIDWKEIGSGLAGTSGRAYWRSLQELSGSAEFRELAAREFPPGASEWLDPVGRRQFLQLAAASLALAGLGACTRQPLEKIVPYVEPPEKIVPGKPRFFASALPLDGFAHGVLVESHMGRPTKIEGNPDHPASQGPRMPWRRRRSSSSTTRTDLRW